MKVIRPSSIYGRLAGFLVTGCLFFQPFIPLLIGTSAHADQVLDDKKTSSAPETDAENGAAQLPVIHPGDSSSIPSLPAFGKRVKGAGHENTIGGNLGDSGGQSIAGISARTDLTSVEASNGCNCNCADPVELTTGEFTHTETDLSIPSRGFPIEIKRTYRSRQEYQGAWGYNWFTNFEGKIQKTANGNYMVLEPGGRREEYVKSGAVYISPERHFDTLTPQGDGSVKIIKKDGSYILYDNLGRLSALVDRFGNRLDFGYDPAGKLPLTGKSDFFKVLTSGVIARTYRLTTLSDSYGRQVAFVYWDATSGNKSGRVKTVTDFIGRQVQYDYDNDGNLITVTSPLGNVTKYTYSTGNKEPNLNHNLLTITAPRESAQIPQGAAYLVNEYDTSDRVSKQTMGGGFYLFNYTTTYTNGFTKTATLYDRKNNRTDYELNAGGMETKVTRYTSAGNFVTTKTFDAQNLLLTETYPLGNGTKYVYDSVGNLTSTRLKTSIAAGDGPTDLVTTIEYEPLFNQVKRTVDPAGNVWVSIFDYEEAHKLSPPTAGGTMWVYNGANAGLGDINGDGTTTQAFGLVVARKFLGPNEGANDTNAANDGVNLGQPVLQPILSTLAYNNYGQLIYSVDPQAIKTQYDYYPENDPDGDGLNIIAGHGTAANGYLKQVIADAGTGKLNLTTQYNYDGVGNVIGITNPRSFKTTFTVNGLNQVTSVLSPLVTLNGGGTATYEIRLEYDLNYNLSKRRIHNLDETGTEVAAEPWIETTYTYDLLNHPLTITEDIGPDPNNPGTILKRTTTFAYDNNENMIQVTKPEGNVIQYVYDERDMIHQVIRDPNVGQPAPAPIVATTTLTYDGNGNVTQVANPLNHSGTLTYDLFDRLTQATDTFGNKSIRSYDFNSNVTSVEAQDSASVTFARTEAVYDELNRSYETHRWISGAVGTSTNYVISKIIYDKNARVTKFTDANNKSVTMTYDNANRLSLVTDNLGNTSQPTYDPNSNVTQSVTSELPGPQTFTRGATFDEIDRVLTIRDQGPDGVYNNTDDRITSMKYDSRGNITTSTDAKGTIVKLAYDALNRRTQVQRDPSGLNIVTNFGFDKNSRLATYTGIRNNGDAAAQYHTTTYSYDRLDRLTQTLYADGKSSTVVLDAVGNVTSATDQNGSAATMTYDNLERLTAMAITRGAGVAGTTARTYGYDALSRMTSATDNNDPADANDETTVSWTYDGLSRALTETQKFGPASPTVNKTLTYTFNDGAGSPDRLNLAKIAYADGTVVRYGRDALDRISNVYYGDNTTNTLANFAYKGFGRTSGRTYYSGTASPVALGTLSVTFDGVKRATSFYNRLSGGATEIASYDYGYDKADNRVYAKFLHAAGTGEIYRYDKGYRVTEAYYGSSAGDITAAISTVNAGNDPAAPSAYASKGTYALDNLGDRSSVTTAGVNGASPVTSTYTSSQATSDYKMNRYTSVAAVTQVHDFNGNLTDDGIFLYVYDTFNRITSVTRKSDSAAIAIYKYDALGRRVRKTVTNSGGLNGTTHYIYQGQMVTEEFAVTNPGATETFTQTSRYINGRGIDERICMERQDVADVDNDGNTTEFQRFYYYTDELGSVRAVTWLDTSTNTEKIVERIEYDIYGKATFKNWGPDRVFGNGDDVTSNTSLVGNPFLFTGQRYDPETGNYYYKMRYFSPNTGRFLSQDPIEYFDGPNMYQYVGSNPTNSTDSMGLADDGGGFSLGLTRGADEEILGAGGGGGAVGPKGGTGVAGGNGASKKLSKGAAQPSVPSRPTLGPSDNSGDGDWLDTSASFFQGWSDTLCFGISSNVQTLVYGDAHAGYRYSASANQAGTYVGHVHNVAMLVTNAPAMATGLKNIAQGASQALKGATTVAQLAGTGQKVATGGAAVIQGTRVLINGVWVIAQGGGVSGASSVYSVGKALAGSDPCRFHHPWPQYLGGKFQQILEALPKSLHDAYHSGLDKILPRAWGSEYYNSLSGAAKTKMLQDLKDYTEGFDKANGTSLLDAMRREGFPL